MKSKLIETVTYKGNGIVPICHSGFDSAIIIVKLGDNAKLLHCKTENGEFTELCSLSSGANVLDISGAENYIKVSGAEIADILLGDCIKDPTEEVPTMAVNVANLYAYTYTEDEENFIIYTYERVTKKGLVTILSPETDLTYGYAIGKGELNITNVSEDGKLTDTDEIEYTPINENNINL